MILRGALVLAGVFAFMTFVVLVVPKMQYNRCVHKAYPEYEDSLWYSVMEKIGKIIRFLKIGVCVYFLGAVVFVIAASWLENRAGKVDEAVVGYGQSQLYSKEDMDAAADILKEKFKEFNGCQLHDIFYISDECSEETRKELNEQGNSYAECMVFGTSFHTPKFFGNGIWNKDKEYTCWQWIFVKDVSGTWQLVSYGHP